VPAIPFPRAWFGAILLGLTLPLHAQQPERVDLGAGRATIHNLIGTMTIEAGTGSSVVAEVSRGGKDAAQLKVMRDGGGLRVLFPGDRFVYPPLGAHSNTNLEVRDDGTFDGDRWGGGRRRVRISGTGSGLEAWADIRVLVPAGKELDMHLAVGAVTVRNVDGNLSLSTASGDIRAQQTKGSLSIGTGSGDITATGHDGTFNAETGSGDVTAGTLAGALAEVETGSGNVSLTGINVTRLSVEAGSGNVKISEAQAPDASVETGSGDVSVTLLSGFQSLTVEAGSGNVEVLAPSTIGATVDISTGSGGIETEFPLQVTRKTSDGLRGTIGDGKGTLTVETGSGDVTLRRKP
jgi:lia operon protein LiaG